MEIIAGVIDMLACLVLAICIVLILSKGEEWLQLNKR